jgi:hypothetical protein
MEPILVVDVGSATTMARLVSGPTGRGELVLDQDLRENHNYWPTAVALGADGFLVGATAIQPGTDQGLPGGRFHLDPAAPDAAIPLDGQTYPRHALLAALLTRLRDLATEKAGREVSRVLLTVPDLPAGCGSARSGLLWAARLAGFIDIELLSAAAAVAMAPAVAAPPGGYLLVCDAGASALRMVLVRAGSAPGTDPGAVLSIRAIAELGGDAMDRAIADDLPFKAGRRQREAVAAWSRSQPYLEPVTRGRERLSESEQVDISPEAVDSVPVPYGRQNLRKKVRSAVDQVARTSRAMLRESLPGKFPERQLSAIVLVGGCAATPFLADELAKLRVPVSLMPESATTAVEGADLWAQHAGARVTLAMPHRPGTRDLAWEFKAGRVTLARWLVGQGGGFASGDRLAVVRSMDDDRVSYLTADFAGTIRQHCIPERDQVDSFDVVAVAEISRATRHDLAQPLRSLGDLPGGRAMAFGQGGAELLLTDSHGRGRVLVMETGAEREVTWPGVMLGSRSAAARDPDAGWVAGIFHRGGFEACGENNSERYRLARFDERRQQPAIQLSADGRLACLIDSQALRGRSRAKVRVSAVGLTARELPELPDRDFYADAPSSVAFSRDGSTVILACAEQGATRKSRGRPPELLVCNLADGRCGTVCALPRPVANARPDLSLAVTPDGSRVMRAGGGTLDVLDAHTGTSLWTINPPGPVTAAAFSASGDLLVLASQQDRWSLLTIWDTGYQSRQLGESERQLRQLFIGYPVTRVLISPDERFLVTGNDDTSTIWGLLP